MASVSSSDTFQPKKYHVFVNFRGSDVRNGFLSFLHKALLDTGVDVFVDENLERGEDISTSLLETIEQSYLSLVIFSENYAFSPWCLDELVKIHECKKTMGQIVIPVFYGVDPTHVQELTGSFRAAKYRKEKKYSLRRVESWCQALKETAELSGLVSQNIRPDTELIKRIINDIWEKLDVMLPMDHSYNNDVLVEIDSRIKEVELLLQLDSLNVHIIGICGMGGIGKTTIAKQVFDRISYQFPTQYFMAGVREKSENLSIDRLQSEVLSRLLGIENTGASTTNLLSPFNRKRLARKKVLIVLDDVSDLKQVDLLIGKYVKYGPGSRIIVTSTDEQEQLLQNRGAKIYKVQGFDMDEARWLFCLHAFRKSNPEERYNTLPIRAVRCAQRLPLALKVLGSILYGKSVEEWEDVLKKLEEPMDNKIQKILRVSYDHLCESDKQIFLDIACLFKGEDKDFVERILGEDSKIGISHLINKSLIFVSSDKKLQMHEMIQQMGKDIICEEKQCGRRSRLWHYEDIRYVLTKNMGTGAIHGISLNMFQIEDVQLSPEAFEGMDNLRVLKFVYGCIGTADDWFDHDSLVIGKQVHLPNGLKFLSGALRFLKWPGYPLNSLPIGFHGNNLVELHMRRSKLKELWEGVQSLENLKLIDLGYSMDLVRIPDLSRAINLEDLRLQSCRSLVEIPSSLKYLRKLTELDLSGCSSLCKLPSCLHPDNLRMLNLSYCSKIEKLPKIPCYERQDGLAMEQVASSFQFFDLDLSGCSMLQALPDNICNLKCLRNFKICYCVNLHKLPEHLGNLESLLSLDAKESGIKGLPDSICYLQWLTSIDISGCANLVGLPEKLGDLASLLKFVAYGSGIKYLPQLPSSLENLDVRDCASLESTSLLVKELAHVSNFMFINCLNLGEEGRNKMIDHALERPFNITNPRLGKYLYLCVPGSEVAERIKYKNKRGSSFSLSVPQCERWSDIRGFYFCALVDPNLFDQLGFPWIQCKIELQSSISTHPNWPIVLHSSFEGHSSFKDSVVLKSRHLFLWRGHFIVGKSFEGTIEFSFFLNDTKNKSHIYDAIIECGVHPIFDDLVTEK